MKSKKISHHHLTPNMLYLLVWGLSGLVMMIALLAVVSSQKMTFLASTETQKPSINVAEIAPAKHNGIMGIFVSGARKITLQPGNTINLPVTIDTRTHRIVSARTYITYDPKVISIGPVNNGNIFPMLSCTEESPEGTIDCTASLQESTYSGRGTMANLTVTGKNSGTTALTFRKGTDAAACRLTDEAGKNVLSQVVNLEITVP